jgi:hypothetical protein
MSVDRPEQSGPGARNTYSTICSLGLLTVVVLLKYVTWSIYTETDVPLISQCFVSRGLVRQQVQ